MLDVSNMNDEGMVGDLSLIRSLHYTYHRWCMLMDHVVGCICSILLFKTAFVTFPILVIGSSSLRGVNWATPSPHGRPMSRFNFRTWTRTLKLVCLFVCFGCRIITSVPKLVGAIFTLAMLDISSAKEICFLNGLELCTSQILRPRPFLLGRASYMHAALSLFNGIRRFKVCATRSPNPL